MSRFEEYLEAVKSVVEGEGTKKISKDKQILDYSPTIGDYEIKVAANGIEYINNRKVKMNKRLGFNYGTQYISTIKKKGLDPNSSIETKKKYKWLTRFHPEKLK